MKALKKKLAYGVVRRLVLFVQKCAKNAQIKGEFNRAAKYNSARKNLMQVAVRWSV